MAAIASEWDHVEWKSNGGRATTELPIACAWTFQSMPLRGCNASFKHSEPTVHVSMACMLAIKLGMPARGMDIVI